MKIFVYLLLCLFVYSFIPHVYAVGEFQADYDVQYAIAPSGTTIVTQNVTLTNKLTNLYPQKYTITIDSEKIKNVIAYDNGGLVTPQISQKSGKTEIMLPFNEKIVGLGKQLRFSLRYENMDIAQKNGNIWEVNIPGVTSDPDLATYLVSLRVPPTFGNNAYMSPPPASGNRWTKEQMVQGGISAAYGTKQVFETSLSYFLENPTVTVKTMEISLPSNTAFQTVVINSLEPKPKTVLEDRDGNWLAQYELLPTQRLDIVAKATVTTAMYPPEGFTQALDDPTAYLKPLKYWESQNPDIQELAKKYTTAREIYDYVVRTLSYDYQRINQTPIRKGAVLALTNPTNAICMEFTDLFIAIARAAGIPAREIIGYAYTNNVRLRPLSLVSDVLHSWPEYYDSARNLWVPIDPTWANTTGGVNYFDKLDFNHIALAVQGISSDYPYPAGFYKKSGSNSKDVNVQFSDKIPSPQEGQLSVSFVFPKKVSSGFAANGSVVIENSSGVPIARKAVTIQSTPFDVAHAEELRNIPPFSKISIPISIALPSYFMQGKGFIAVTAGDQVTRYDFDIEPFIYRFTIPFFIIAVILIAIAFFSLRSHILWKHRKR
jgi:transglutaminase-like putative cysteine protease